jgi:hypothetical protein
MTRPHSAYWTLFLLLGATAIAVDSCGGRTLSETNWGQAGGGDAGSGQGTGGTRASGSGGGSAAGGGRAGGVTTTNVGAGGFTGPTGSSTTNSGTGTGAGGLGTAGRAGTGGSSSCANVGCLAIACGPGFVSVFQPGACCPICQPVPCTGACVIPMCPSGTHLDNVPGMCCPTCVKDAPDSCTKGRQAYFDFRSQLLDKYNSIGCKTAKDCGLVYENNRCVSSCGTAFPISLADSAQQNLRTNAESNCSTCPATSTPPCVPAFAYCVEGRCTVLNGPPPP